MPAGPAGGPSGTIGCSGDRVISFRHKSRNRLSVSQQEQLMENSQNSLGGRSLPTCTVVICTRDRPAILDRCMEGVSSLQYSHFEVLVVDNSSTDWGAREVAARWGARYVVEPIVGASRARNRGALECSSEVVAYLDDDAVPEPGWLSAIAAEFSDPLVMAVAGKVLALSLETEAEMLRDLGWNAGPDQRVLFRGT